MAKEKFIRGLEMVYRAKMLELHIVSLLTHSGHKTEARLLRIQARETENLFKKWLDNLCKPTANSTFAALVTLDKRMLHTFRESLSNVWKESRPDWKRYQRIQMARKWETQVQFGSIKSVQKELQEYANEILKKALTGDVDSLVLVITALKTALESGHGQIQNHSQ
jgi:hypothetical protein